MTGTRIALLEASLVFLAGCEGKPEPSAVPDAVVEERLPHFADTAETRLRGEPFRVSLGEEPPGPCTETVVKWAPDLMSDFAWPLRGTIGEGIFSVPRYGDVRIDCLGQNLLSGWSGPAVMENAPGTFGQGPKSTFWLRQSNGNLLAASVNLEAPIEFDGTVVATHTIPGQVFWFESEDRFCGYRERLAVEVRHRGKVHLLGPGDRVEVGEFEISAGRCWRNSDIRCGHTDEVDCTVLVRRRPAESRRRAQ